MCLLETKALNLLTCQDDFCGREKKDDRKIDFAANQVFDLTFVQVMLWSIITIMLLKHVNLNNSWFEAQNNDT